MSVSERRAGKRRQSGQFDPRSAYACGVHRVLPFDALTAGKLELVRQIPVTGTTGAWQAVREGSNAVFTLHGSARVGCGEARTASVVQRAPAHREIPDGPSSCHAAGHLVLHAGLESRRGSDALDSGKALNDPVRASPHPTFLRSATATAIRYISASRLGRAQRSPTVFEPG